MAGDDCEAASKISSHVTRFMILNRRSRLVKLGLSFFSNVFSGMGSCRSLIVRQSASAAISCTVSLISLLCWRCWLMIAWATFCASMKMGLLGSPGNPSDERNRLMLRPTRNSMSSSYMGSVTPFSLGGAQPNALTANVAYLGFLAGSSA
ncbi:MAG: hypothetical protein QW445_07640 [Candidatus Bathyarchaeia archaeon]